MFAAERGLNGVLTSRQAACQAQCKPLGFLWVWLEGDDPVCRDGSTRSRADIHAEVADKIIAFLKPVEAQ